MHRLVELIRYDWPMHFLLLVTNWLPDNVIFLRLRGFLVKPFLGKCGKDLRLGRNVTFYNPLNIEIKNNVYISYGCLLMAIDQIIIEDQVMFGPYCVVTSGNHSSVKGSYRYGPIVLAPIRIGAGSWIGSHVVVTAGSVIGENTVVGAGAVVSKEIPSNVIAGGIPAKKIKDIKPENE